MMKEIKVLCCPDGTIHIETFGFAGAACLNATKILEAAFGIANAERQHKPEFYAQEVVAQQQYQR